MLASNLRATRKHGKNKERDSVRGLISSELSYLKKVQVLLLGDSKNVAKLAKYFYGKGGKARLTILSFGKKELLEAVDATSKFEGIRYAYSKDIYTGMPEDEFGLVICYGTFDSMGSNRAISFLKELYRISKPNGIVIIIGDSIDYLYKHYNRSNFSSCEIVEGKGI